ncbi:MAG TPA: mucoidy inhibitor MuiA family protein [Candidatus Deferrimicrobiaceae bacterium]|jgi:uncharacterized protein (TIGR02231 family)
MRRFPVRVPAFIILAIPFLASMPAFAARAEVYPSKVTQAILYPDMAEVTRTIPVDPPSSVVVLEGLPAGLQPASLAAKVTAGQATIVGFSVEDTFRTEPAVEKVRDLEKKIEALNDAKRVAEGAIRASRREQELLDQGIQAVYRGEPGDATPKDKARPSRLTPAEIEAALALFRGRVDSIDGALLKREQEIRTLDREIVAAQQELDKVRNPEPLRQKKITIQLSRSASCKVALTYLTTGAGFAPRYNVRLSPGSGALAFELAGDAWQRTGEDWVDAAMKVSTVRPGRMAQLPPLPPWEIDFKAPPEPPRAMMKLEKSARPMASMAAGRGKALDELNDMAGAEPPPPPVPSPLRRFASFEVTLDGPQALPGSGEKKSFLLAKREQQASVSWLSIPKVADGAFVTAEGTNGTGLPLISAPAALFLEDAFIGSGFVTDASGRPAEVPEGAAFRIGFGKDPSLQAIRKETLRQKDEGGVFGRFKRIRYRYEYTVTNFRKEPATLTMLDRIPVAHSREIEIKDVEAPGAKIGGKEAGEVRWELPLAAGEKKTLTLTFAVEYPIDKDVDGL